MKYTFIIDDDTKCFSDIREAIEEIDSQMVVRQYTSLDGFVQWLKGVIEKDKKVAGGDAAPSETPAPPPGDSAAGTPASAAKPAEQDAGPIELALVICKYEFVHERGFGLFQKTRDYLLQKGMTPKEVPTVFMLSAFDQEDFDFSKFENQIVSNILFKPFDRLILREHMRAALSGGKAQRSGDLYRQKTTSKIEMLKDIHMVQLTELGFITSSDREVSVGTIGKYYSKLFQTQKGSSAFARCIKCAPHASQAGWFEVHFDFLNINNDQIHQIRKVIKADKNHEVEVFEPPKKSAAKTFKAPQAATPTANSAKTTAPTPAQTAPVTDTINVVLLEASDGSNTQQILETAFSNIVCVPYNDFLSFGAEIDPLDSKLSTSKSKDKPLPFAAGKIFFDLKQTKIVTMDPAPPETAQFLGVGIKSSCEQDQYMLKKVYAEDRNRFIDLQKKMLPVGPNSKPQIFRFRSAEDRLAFFKISALHQIKHEKLGEVVEMQIAECNDTEKKDFLMSLSRLPKKVDAIILEAAYLGENPGERWKVILDLIKERGSPVVPKIICVANRPVSTEDLMEKQAPVEDVLARPVDSPHLFKRLKKMFPALQLKEETVEIARLKMDEIIKAAQPVKAEEVSEAGLSVRYNRALPFGSFRKFVLWVPHEIGLPEFLASVCAVEEIEENKQKIFICHFVFFGVKDASLKHIRRWIKDYYVHSKEGEG